MKLSLFKPLFFRKYRPENTYFSQKGTQRTNRSKRIIIVMANMSHGKQRRLDDLIKHNELSIKVIAKRLRISIGTVERRKEAMKSLKIIHDSGVHLGSKRQQYQTESEMLSGLPDYGTIKKRYASTEMRNDWKLIQYEK